MKLAIMQPYFFPYIGYFQLIKSVDEFVIYDNIQYTKKGWINRNRILVNQSDDYITLPLKKDSDYLHVNQRYLSDNWAVDRKKMLNRIVESYRKAPQFEKVFPLIENCIYGADLNLFDFIHYTLKEILSHLSIGTKITLSSSIDIDHSLISEEKVLEICCKKNASIYINPIGGVNLYSKDNFGIKGIDLLFQKSSEIEYKQFNDKFIPWLSIIDILMFNTPEEVNDMLDKFELI
jgi:hypothetical protein